MRVLPKWFTENSHLLEGQDAATDTSGRKSSSMYCLRRISDPTTPTGHRPARPGDEYEQISGGEPYSLCSGHACFQEFGPGVSFYFRQLLWLAALFFLAGLAMIPSIGYNLSYFPWAWTVDTSIFPPGTVWLTLGTAAGAGRENLSFQYNGIPELVVVAILVIASVLCHVSEEKAGAEVEARTQPSQPYSVCISNPLEDIRDPDAYLPLLTPYGEVVMITMVLDNGMLLQHLVEEKEFEKRNPTLKVSAFKGVKIRWWKLWLWYVSLGRWEDAEVLIYRWSRLADKVDELVKLPHEGYKVQRVFAVFNSELSARACLMGMRSGLLEGGVPSRMFFHGRILRVTKPVEPTQVIWENLHYSPWRRWLSRIMACLVGGLAVGMSILVQYYLTDLEQRQLATPPGERDSTLTNARLILMAPFIIAVNKIIPWVMRAATRWFEVPETETELQESITFKVAVARCVNTAVALYWVTPYAQMLRPRSIACVVLAMLADCFYPLLVGCPLFFQRPFLSLFIKNYDVTPEKPELWDLADKYSDVVTTIFLGLFFAPVIPTTLFLTSLALVIRYWVEKARLFRGCPPPVDSTQPTTVRDFLAVCLVVHVIMARTFFVNWPFRYEREEVVCGLFCSSKDWLLDSQWKLAKWCTGLLALSVAVVIQHHSWAPIRYLASFFTTKPTFYCGASEVTYRSRHQGQGLSGYIPVVRSKTVNPQTYLAANVDDLPEEEDMVTPNRSRGKRSVRTLLASGRHKLDPRLFSTVKYYYGEKAGAQGSPDTAYGTYARGLLGRFFT